MSDSATSRRSERSAAVLASIVLLSIVAALFTSCGGNDLQLGGSGIATATPVETNTPTP